MKLDDFWLFMATIPEPLGEDKLKEEFDPDHDEVKARYFYNNRKYGTEPFKVKMNGL